MKAALLLLFCVLYAQSSTLVCAQTLRDTSTNGFFHRYFDWRGWWSLVTNSSPFWDANRNVPREDIESAKQTMAALATLASRGQKSAGNGKPVFTWTPVPGTDLNRGCYDNESLTVLDEFNCTKDMECMASCKDYYTKQSESVYSFYCHPDSATCACCTVKSKDDGFDGFISGGSGTGSQGDFKDPFGGSGGSSGFPSGGFGDSSFAPRSGSGSNNRK